jgi:DNA-binding Lrp family transcriptional regulator
MGKNRTKIQRDEIFANDDLAALDERDNEILRLLLLNLGNREIAQKLKMPISTVQRRTRKLFQSGIIRNIVELNYREAGLRTGLLHIYLRDGNAYDVADRIKDTEGIRSVSIHIGNSDIICNFTFKDPNQLLNAMNVAKSIEGVEKVVWSEEVYVFPNHSVQRIL